MIRILDHGYVKFIEHWGSDERIVEAARMSTDKGFLGWGPKHKPECAINGIDFGDVSLAECSCGGPYAGDEKLLKYLYNHKHATPFEMAGMAIEVQAPIMVFREWHRHRTQCLSGDSMITCVSPSGSSYRRSIQSIFELKHGGVVDSAPTKHKNGYSKAGTPVTRRARRKDAWRTRILPNCQTRLLRVLDETTGEFALAKMADVWESGVKELFLLQTLNGYSIRASAEHPFFTVRGWVKMKDIIPGDKVARIGKVSSGKPKIPPALRSGIGVWTSMMRGNLIDDVDQCYLCRRVFPKSKLVLDHVIPVSVNLLTALDVNNLQPACVGCHRQKTNSEQPSRVGMTRLGIRWETVIATPEYAGKEMTYDIEVDGPHHNYVANFLVVHNSYNEMSARYTPLPDVNYVPSAERCLVVLGKNKQAAAIEGADVLTHESVLEWLAELEESYGHAERVYQSGLKRGIPKELARLCVPVGRYSKMRACANLRNWLAFLTLRMAPDAQWEIRQFANAVGTLIADQFPRTWSLFHVDK